MLGSTSATCAAVRKRDAKRAAGGYQSWGSALLIKKKTNFPFQLGSGVLQSRGGLFDLDGAKSISYNHNRVIPLEVNVCARHRRPQMSCIFRISRSSGGIHIVQQAQLVTAKLHLNYFYCWDFSNFPLAAISFPGAEWIKVMRFLEPFNRWIVSQTFTSPVAPVT